MENLNRKYKDFGGIYCFLNKENNKRYIGGTTNLYNRTNQHIKGLRANRHENEYLQNAFNKYGEESFEFKVLEEYMNNKDLDFKNFLLFREQIYLDRFTTKGVDYNMRPCAWDATGTSLSSKGRERIKKLRMEHPSRCKSCYQYDSEGNLINEYVSVAECCRINDYTSSKLQGACRTNSYYKNFFWSYNNNHKFESLILNEKRLNLKSPLSKPIIILETGEIFDSMRHLARTYNVSRDVVRWTLNKETKFIKKFTIKLYGESE